jgi:hypothetical protein
MDDWSYVALAYVVVWGAVALYAWTLWHRITQARITAAPSRRGETTSDSTAAEGDLVCDAPSSP